MGLCSCRSRVGTVRIQICDSEFKHFTYGLAFIRYFKNISERLTTLKKTEESLRRKKMSGTGTNINVSSGTAHDDAATSMSDEDKMRLQILLDVKQFGKEV